MLVGLVGSGALSGLAVVSDEQYARRDMLKHLRVLVVVSITLNGIIGIVSLPLNEYESCRRWICVAWVACFLLGVFASLTMVRAMVLARRMRKRIDKESGYTYSLASARYQSLKPFFTTIRIDGMEIDGGDMRNVYHDCPALSWEVEADFVKWCQVRCEIQIQRGDDQWSPSVVVKSTDHNRCKWPFSPIQPNETVSIKLQVWGSQGEQTGWTPPIGITYVSSISVS